MPFSADGFFGVFQRYNAALWPAQLGAYAVAALCVIAAWRGGRSSTRIAAGALAALWVATGLGYFVAFFSALTPAAVPVGVLFAVEGVLLAIAAARGRLAFGPHRPSASVATLLVAYAMIGYPAIHLATGHALAALPAFGLTPCPLTLFTFGILLLSARTPAWIVVVPLLWSFVGTWAAARLGVVADFALPVAGLGATVLLLLRPRVAESAPVAPPMLARARAFLELDRIALVGVSRDPRSFSRAVLHELALRSYDVVPIHPEARELAGRRCFARVSDVVPRVQAALVLTPPARASEVVRDCIAAGVRTIWFHRGAGQGSATPEAVALCRAAGVEPVTDLCPFMVLPDGGWMHRVHARLRQSRLDPACGPMSP